MFRRKKLCPTPAQCHYAQMEADSAGGLPCEGCPEQRLSDYLASQGGQPIAAAVDLDTAIQMGVKVSLEQIPYPQMILLRTLTEERNKFQSEEMKAKPDGG